MASGKASRRKRAAQRVPAPPTSGRARPARLWWIVGGAVGAVALAAVLGALLARGGEPQVAEGAALPDAAEAAAVFEGVAQRGLALGDSDAPVTLVEFVDLQCPFCRQFAVETMPTLVDKYVRTGKARIEIRGLAFLGPDSERGLRAAFAAARQDRMFELMELLYYNQGAENSGWLSDEVLHAAARSIPGIDASRLVGDMGSGEVSNLIEEHAAEAERREISSTPTLLVGRTGGELELVELSSPTDLEAIESAIAAA